jgi:hypothetical protein
VVAAYCAEFHKDNPPPDRFDFIVGGTINPGMACVLSNAERERLSVAATQAAIWIFGEHLSFQEMNTRMTIGAVEWSQAEAVASGCSSR